MNCAYHLETPNTAFCIRCGKALCDLCIRRVRDSIYCETCLAELVAGRTPASKPPVNETIYATSPGAAFALGLIPGVGAIYNGEFLKAAVHVLIFGSLVTIQDELRFAGALFGMLTFAFYMYMPFEAYYTAKKRKLRAEGIELETPIDRLQQQFGGMEKRELWGGVALVVIGGLLLLGNLNVFNLNQIGRIFWPAVLVGLGFWLLKRHQGRAV